MGRRKYEDLTEKSKEQTLKLIAKIGENWQNPDVSTCIPSSIQMRSYERNAYKENPDEEDPDPKNWGVLFLQDMCKISMLTRGNLKKFQNDLLRKVKKREPFTQYTTPEDIRDIKVIYENVLRGGSARQLASPKVRRRNKVQMRTSYVAAEENQGNGGNGRRSARLNPPRGRPGARPNASRNLAEPSPSEEDNLPTPGSDEEPHSSDSDTSIKSEEDEDSEQDLDSQYPSHPRLTHRFPGNQHHRTSFRAFPNIRASSAFATTPETVSRERLLEMELEAAKHELIATQMKLRIKELEQSQMVPGSHSSAPLVLDGDDM